MARRKRDYKAEYARRISRGKARGLSRSQARGHPRKNESYVSAAFRPDPWNRVLEAGVKRMRAGESLTATARSLHISPERLRAYLERQGVVYKERSRWKIGSDNRSRELPIYTRGKELTVILPDFKSSSLAGSYMAAVKQFLETNDPVVLKEFAGRGVIDARGEFHPFETRPNVLYRLAETQTEPFQEVYRIVA